MTREEMDFIGSMNMCDEISNEAYKKIMTHCEEQEPCEDAISRQAVLDEIIDYNNDLDYTTNELYDRIKRMPPVTPQPKVGEWLKNGELCKCSICHSNVLHSAVKAYNCCYRCGSRMEVSE